MEAVAKLLQVAFSKNKTGAEGPVRVPENLAYRSPPSGIACPQLRAGTSVIHDSYRRDFAASIGIHKAKCLRT
jgi:hypothetical protein